MAKFIIEYEHPVGNEIVQVWPWEDWVRRPIQRRTWNTVVIEAQDELDAYKQALLLEEQFNDEQD